MDRRLFEGRVRVPAFALLIAAIWLPVTAEAGLVLQPVIGTGQWTLLPNGGFETGKLTPWANEVNTHLGQFVVSTENPYQGRYSVKAVPTQEFATYGFGLRTGEIPVIPGETYVLSGFFNLTQSSPGNFYLDLNDTPDEVTTGVYFDNYGISGWFFAWEIFTVPKDVISVRVRMIRDHIVHVGEYGYIDQAGLTLARDFVPPTSAVPEPSTLASAGVAVVVALAYVRYRRKGNALQGRIQ